MHCTILNKTSDLKFLQFMYALVIVLYNVIPTMGNVVRIYSKLFTTGSTSNTAGLMDSLLSSKTDHPTHPLQYNVTFVFHVIHSRGISSPN